MFVECLIEREGPTEVNLYGFKYRFEDDGTGARVADVNSEDHRNYLIGTGFYQIYDPKMRKQVEKEQAIKEATEKKQGELKYIADGKIDKVKLSQMLRSGKTQRLCAKVFGVTESAISQAKKDLKDLNVNVVKNVALENAARVVDKNLNAIDQLGN